MIFGKEEATGLRLLSQLNQTLMKKHLFLAHMWTDHSSARIRWASRISSNSLVVYTSLAIMA